jgi:hypothetical protein
MKTIIGIITLFVVAFLAYSNISHVGELTELKTTLAVRDSTIQFQTGKINSLKTCNQKLFEMNKEIDTLLAKENNLIKENR